MRETFIYPCVVRYDEGVYYANFPDFEACFTDAESLEELYINTKEVLNGVLFTMLENGMKIPKPNNDVGVILTKNEFLILVDAPIASIKERLSKMSVKKTLTIPKWLNDVGIRENINFSQVLQDGLKRELNIK